MDVQAAPDCVDPLGREDGLRLVTDRRQAGRQRRLAGHARRPGLGHVQQLGVRAELEYPRGADRPALAAALPMERQHRFAPCRTGRLNARHELLLLAHQRQGLRDAKMECDRLSLRSGRLLGRGHGAAGP